MRCRWKSSDSCGRSIAARAHCRRAERCRSRCQARHRQQASRTASVRELRPPGRLQFSLFLLPRKWLERHQLQAEHRVAPRIEAAVAVDVVIVELDAETRARRPVQPCDEPLRKAHDINDRAVAGIEVPGPRREHRGVGAIKLAGVAGGLAAKPKHRVAAARRIDALGLAAGRGGSEIDVEGAAHCTDDALYRDPLGFEAQLQQPVGRDRREHADNDDDDEPARGARSHAHCARPPPPLAADAMSHIGRNTPSARISTRMPMHTSRIGSALALRPSTSSVTSRSYMSAISDISWSISPVSSPTATICSTTGLKTPVATAVLRMLSPRSMPSRIFTMRDSRYAFSTTSATIESPCTIGTPLFAASAKPRENLASVALWISCPTTGSRSFSPSQVKRPFSLRT